MQNNLSNKNTDRLYKNYSYVCEILTSFSIKAHPKPGQEDNVKWKDKSIIHEYNKAGCSYKILILDISVTFAIDLLW